MTKDEMIKEINKVLPHLTERSLDNLLLLARKLENETPSLSSLKSNLEKLLSGDKDLFENLSK